MWFSNPPHYSAALFRGFSSFSLMWSTSRFYSWSTSLPVSVDPGIFTFLFIQMTVNQSQGGYLCLVSSIYLSKIGQVI